MSPETLARVLSPWAWAPDDYRRLHALGDAAMADAVVVREALGGVLRDPEAERAFLAEPRRDLGWHTLDELLRGSATDVMEARYYVEDRL